MTPAWLRPLAEADLVERSRYYAAEAGKDVAERLLADAQDLTAILEALLIDELSPV